MFFRTRADEIANAHLEDGSSSSYLGIVRLSFNALVPRDRRKKFALYTLRHAYPQDKQSKPDLINPWLSPPIATPIYVIATASRHSGISSGNFSFRGSMSSCRLAVVSRHFFLNIYISRYSARIPECFRALENEPPRGGQGYRKVFDRMINGEELNRAWEVVTFRVARKGRFVVKMYFSCGAVHGKSVTGGDRGTKGSPGCSKKKARDLARRRSLD